MLRRNALSTSDFVEGLSHLTADDVHELHTSPERSAYEQLLWAYAEQAARPKEFGRALVTYQRLIEDRIIRRLKRVAAQPTTTGVRFSGLKAAATETFRFVVMHALPAAIDASLTQGFFGPLQYVVDRLQTRHREKREVAERTLLRMQFEAEEIDKRELVEDFARRGSPIVRAQLIIDKAGMPGSIVQVDRPSAAGVHNVT